MLSTRSSSVLSRSLVRANVTIGHETKPVVVEGVSRLIDELIYNPASNAIRYNRPQRYGDAAVRNQRRQAPVPVGCRYWYWHCA